MRGVSVARWLSLLVGILLILAGVGHLINPIDSGLYFIKAFAIILIGVGVLRLIRYFSYDVFRTGSFFIGGALDLFLGLIILSNLETSLVAFVSVIGFWVLFNGIIEISAAIDFKALGIRRWWLTLISGLIGLACGFLLINDYLLSAIYLSALLSIYLIMTGITFISTFFALSRFRRLF